MRRHSGEALKKQRTVIPDTSTLVQLKQIWITEPDAHKVSSLLEHLHNTGWKFVLTAHQVIELLQHENFQEARERLDFLRWLSDHNCGWFSASRSWNTLGLVPHVTAAELLGLTSGVSGASLRASVQLELLRNSHPPINEFEGLAWLRHEFQKRAHRNREIASIVRTSVADRGNETLGELRRKKARPASDIPKQVSAGAAKMANEMKLTGDRRLQSPESIAAAFYGEVSQQVAGALQPGEVPADALIRYLGLDPKEIPDDMLVRDLAHLGEFRAKVRLACEHVGISPEKAERYELRDVPTCFLQNRLRVARVRSGARASGSDITDSYLASLCPYVDAVIVDKRTNELMKQVRREAGWDWIGTTIKIKNVQQLPEELEQVD